MSALSCDGLPSAWSDAGSVWTLTVERYRIGVSVRGDAAVVAPGTRAEIVELSEASRRRLRSTIENALEPWTTFGTLTVREWDRETIAPWKSSLERWLSWHARREALAHGPSWSMVWWIEFQRRGAPHLHFVTTHATPWRPLAERWAWEHGQPEIVAHCSRLETLSGGWSQAGAYAAKYAHKAEQKDVPEGMRWTGRWWGQRGSKKTVAAAIRVIVSRGNASQLASVREALIAAREAARSSQEAFGRARKSDFSVYRPGSMTIYRPSDATKGVARVAMLKLALEEGSQLGQDTATA